MTDEKKTIPTGLIVSGICKGHLQETNNGYTNDYILIKVGERINEIGEAESIIERVNLFGNNKQQFIDRANHLKDKHVMIAINRAPAARNIRDAFMRNTINRRSELVQVL